MSSYIKSKKKISGGTTAYFDPIKRKT